jgi:hypothetical protein
VDAPPTIDGTALRAHRPPGSSHLRIEVRDRVSILNARVKRMFPLSQRHAYLSIQDAAGKEHAILETVDGLDPDTRRLLDEELDRRYFCPKIERIDLLRPEAGMWRFCVQTQRGPFEFYVRNWRDSAHEVTPGRWQIHSVDGQRFEIESAGDLDGRSRILLEQVL